MRLPVLLCSMLLSLFAVDGARADAACSPRPEHSGQATQYAYVPGTGNCELGGDVSEPTVAISTVDYAGSAACGRCMRITGPIGSVVARVVDQCPTCAPGSIDLNAAAYAAIGNSPPFLAPVTWHFTPCPTTGPIRVGIAPGSNAFFLQVKPIEHRYGIAALELLTGSGFIPLPRTTAHRFQATSPTVPVPIASPFTIRLTDTNGQQVVVPGLALTPDTVQASAQQLPLCHEDVAAVPVFPFGADE